LASYIGEPAADPWADLRGGLVPVGDKLWEKAQALLGGSPPVGIGVGAA
jgi:hypothetical protein